MSCLAHVMTLNSALTRSLAFMRSSAFMRWFQIWYWPKRFWRYFAWTRNAIARYMYPAILCPCYVAFLKTCGLQISEMSPLLLPTTMFLILSCLVAWHLGTSTDPGVARLGDFAFDGLMFVPNMQCRTCHREKPARSKHCSVCGYCVSRMDHHCIWINNCVGERNYKYFLLLIVVNSVSMVYGIVLLGWIILGRLSDFESISKLSVYQRLKVVDVEILLLALCIVGAIASLYMVVFHSELIAKNETTNEHYKALDILDEHEYAHGVTGKQSLKIHPYNLGSWFKNAKSMILGRQVSDCRT